MSGFPPGSETNAVRQIRFPIGTENGAENIHAAAHGTKTTLPNCPPLLGEVFGRVSRSLGTPLPWRNPRTTFQLFNEQNVKV